MDSRESILGFKPQKELIYNRLLPYADKIDDESQQLLIAVKTNLTKAVALREVSPGVTYWTWQCVKYIQLYGRKFTKSDHVALIELAYELITIPQMEMDVVQHLTHLLILLLKKRELLSRDDLVLPWYPLYQLYEKTLYSPYEHLEMLLLPSTMESTLKSLVRSCRVYFSSDATQEMLDEWRPLLCPFDMTMSKGMAYLELFLPTVLPPEEHHKGFKLWFDEFMEIWNSCHNSPPWEAHLVWLFARTAVSNIGYINWDPYMPNFFTRLMRNFNLPGGSGSLQVFRNNGTFETNAVVAWIVAMLGGGSQCQDHIDKLFKILESYYHPSNNGKWMIKLQRLLYKLPADLLKRLQKERYKPRDSFTPIPEKNKLTEDDITRFVKSMKHVVFLAIFSKGGCGDSAVALKNLSLVRPEIVIPPLLEKMYSSLETLTEPHRLVATMHCMVSVSRSLVRGGKYFPEGPSHIIPLLMSSLPGIDPNDIKKCMVTFQFISTFTTLVPLVDCSSAVNHRTDLTPQEYDLCIATAELENFVLQFMDRCFVLIENSSLENTSRLDRETEKMNAEESILGVALSSTFTSILTQSSPAIFKSALQKLHAFISGHILETRISGKLAANMCRSASRVDSGQSLQMFLPHTSKLILTLTESEDVLKEEKLDDELLFSMLLMSEIVRGDGAHLIAYKDIIMKVLARTLHLTSKQGYLMACALLRHLLKSLTTITALDFKSSSHLNEKSSNPDYLPIREWGKAGDLSDLDIQWHIPSQAELSFATDLLEAFLKPELEKLEAFSRGQHALTRDELQCSLNIVLDCIFGAGEALPLWGEENIKILDSCVPLFYFRMRDHVDSPSISLRDGSNVRETCAKVVGQVMNYIMKACEDDTNSLFLVIRIYKMIMFHWGIRREDFDKRWKGFHVVKKALEDKTSGLKKHIRALLVDRIMLQHENRMLERSKCPFTNLHKDMTNNILMLSVSHYSQVRVRAQEALQLCLQNFPVSYRLFVPQVVESILKDPQECHEEFKGSLYFLLGHKHNTVLTVNDWSVVNLVWPALVKSLPSEKPSIIRLLDQITESIQKNLETNQIELEVPESCIIASEKLFRAGNPKPLGEFSTQIQIKEGVQLLKKQGNENLEYYVNTVEALLTSAESGTLHWRHYQMATTMLLFLIRHDCKLSARGVNFFVKNLVHDSIIIRKQAISAVAAITKQQKRFHPKRNLDVQALRSEKSSELFAHNGKKPVPLNFFLQYNRKYHPNTKEIWDESVFVHKPHIGYYGWPKELSIYEVDSKQPVLNRQKDELEDDEKPIYNCFIDPAFVQTLIKFLSLEERKGIDKFNAKRFYMFKGLFRNFGDTFLPIFLPHLQRLISDKQDSGQRCAAEIIAGIIRGSKHWPFEMMEDLRKTFIPLLSTAFENITSETVGDWGTCIATSSESRDPNKYYWLFELLMDNPIRGQGGSFLESSRLYLLLGVLAQQEWRVFELLHRVLDYVRPHLTHGFQNVREKISSILCNIFLYDVSIPATADTLMFAPKRSTFIQYIISQLLILVQTREMINQKSPMETNHSNHENQGLDSKECKEVVNLFKTTCKWLITSIPRTMYSVPQEILEILPLICMWQSDTTDEELQLDCMYTLTVLGQAMLLPGSIEMAIKTVENISENVSWHARASALSFLQLMVFSNMFNIISNPEWVSSITRLVLKLLADERLEVRERAAESLGGLIHGEFIKVNERLLGTFKTACQKKIPQRRLLVPPKGEDPLIQRHAGVLGLCACVNAYPYEVPDFLPDILMTLGDHLNDPQPIPATVKKTLSNFRRTHHDNWRDHKLKFTDDQLAVITDLLVSPSYYA